MINGAERPIKESGKLGKVREKSGNFEIMSGNPDFVARFARSISIDK